MLVDVINKINLKDEKGVAIPEFMVSFPVLVLLVFGSIDLGSLLQQYLIVQHAASIGAEKIQTLPSIESLSYCDTSTSSPTEITANGDALQPVIDKMNSVLSPSTDKLNTSYSFCQKTVNSQKRIQVLVSAEYKNSNQLFHLKGAQLNAKVEVPYFFGG